MSLPATQKSSKVSIRTESWGEYETAHGPIDSLNFNRLSQHSGSEFQKRKDEVIQTDDTAEMYRGCAMLNVVTYDAYQKSLLANEHQLRI